MLFPLIPAGIAALGAAGRAINSPTGQRVIQGGINTLQPYVNTLSNFIGRQVGTTPVTSTGTLSGLGAAALPTFSMSYLSDPSTALQTAGEDLKFFGYDIPKAGTDLIVEQIEKLLEKEEKEDKKKKKKKKKKEDEIPEVPMKKGGMVKSKKPKRKRKKYKSSTFVKMKGSKRYI
jgi:hypothetical protein|tara:strand:+ start:816 stop:1340 length:525 start_codon:yes stop_codon:yes gene_type:complete